MRASGLLAAVLALFAPSACNPRDFDDLLGSARAAPDAGLAESSDAASEDAASARDAGPSARDASPDAGELVRDGGPTPAPASDGETPRDAEVSADAQVGSDARVAEPPPTPDACGQLRPLDPSLFGIAADGVTFLPAIPQHPGLSPRAVVDIARYNDRVLWLFGTSFVRDTLLVSSSSSIEVASFERPYDLPEARPDAAVPGSLLPELATDLALAGAGERLTYEPGNLLRFGDTTLLFYGVSVLGAGFRSRTIGTRVARLTFDGTTVRALPVQELVFPAGTPGFRLGLTVDEHVYLYSCPQNSEQLFDCLLARAPLASATSGAAFEYWTASGWSSDVTAVTPVIRNAQYEISVSYNPYLRRYLAVHLVWVGTEIRLSSAERPEGPWQEFASFQVPPAPASFHLQGIEHPELARDCGRTLVLTYSHALEDTREMRRIEVRLR